MKQIKRTKIADALKSTDFGSEINVKGWVRTRRGNKNISFVALNDGSTINNLQIVIENAKFGEEFLKPITTGACIGVNGILVQSMGREQTVEVQAHEIEIYGTADPATYPLQKKGHSLEFLREIAHLRPRTNTFGAIFRIRHHMSYAIHKYFHDRGFYYFHTPIITASDAEGAGALFQVTSLDLDNVPKKEDGRVDYSQDFFGRQTNLTVSRAIILDPMAA
jgi:asparaginyl-tRNA synthetase